jgi:hypothetical protein
MVADGKEGRSRLERYLAHPLLLLALGALFTWFFGPYLTQQWQDRQQRLDDQRAEAQVKIALIQQIAKVSEEEITSIHAATRAFAFGGTPGWHRAAPVLASAAQGWPRDSAEINAELRAWFPPRDANPGSVVGRWASFDQSVNYVELYLVRPMFPDSDARSRTTATQLQHGMSKTARSLEEARRRDPFRDEVSQSLDEREKNRAGDAQAWGYLIPELRDARDRLIRAVLTSNATGFPR